MYSGSSFNTDSKGPFSNFSSRPSGKVPESKTTPVVTNQELTHEKATHEIQNNSVLNSIQEQKKSLEAFEQHVLNSIQEQKKSLEAFEQRVFNSIEKSKNLPIEGSNNPPNFPPGSSAHTDQNENDPPKHDETDGLIVKKKSDFDSTREATDRVLTDTFIRFWTNPNPWIVNVGSGLIVALIGYSASVYGPKLFSKSTDANSSEKTPADSSENTSTGSSGKKLSEFTISVKTSNNLDDSEYMVEVFRQSDSDLEAVDLGSYEAASMLVASLVTLGALKEYSNLRTLHGPPVNLPLLPPLPPNQNGSTGGDDVFL